MGISPEMWSIISDVLVVFVTVATPVIIGFILRELQIISEVVQAWLMAKIGKSNYETMVSLAHDAVSTADQLGLSERIANTGQAKKDFALAKVQASLLERGIHINLNDIDAAIEAEVNKIFHQP